MNLVPIPRSPSELWQGSVWPYRRLGQQQLLLFGLAFTWQLTYFLRVLMLYNSPLDSLSACRPVTWQGWQAVIESKYLCEVNTQPYNNNTDNIIFRALCLIKQPSINDKQPSAVIISPHFTQADNDCLRLIIIGVELLIKYNALKNHVIVIFFPAQFSQHHSHIPNGRNIYLLGGDSDSES